MLALFVHTSRSLSSTLCSTANSFPGPGAQPLIPKLHRSSCLFDSRHQASRWVSTKHPHPSFLLSIIALCSLGDPRAHWYQKYKMIKVPGKQARPPKLGLWASRLGGPETPVLGGRPSPRVGYRQHRRVRREKDPSLSLWANIQVTPFVNLRTVCFLSY